MRKYNCLVKFSNNKISMSKRIKQLKVRIKEIKRIKQDTFLLSFISSHIAKNALPGNFLHVKIDEVILRRPFSIHKIKGSTVYILFKVKGRGTKAFSRYRSADFLDVIGPLGQGFRWPKPIAEDSQVLLVAGGIGVAPLVFLAEKLRKAHSSQSRIQSVALLGAKSKNEVLCESEFKKSGFKVKIATDDGSKGFKGIVTNLLKQRLSTTDYRLRTSIYACGPEAMLWEIGKLIKKYPRYSSGSLEKKGYRSKGFSQKSPISCQVSFEQFMGCGMGVCCVCSMETKQGYKKVCKDGPVFDIKDIW